MTARTISIIGTILVAAYAAWAGLQMLVLNPLAAVPGKSLPEIEASMAQWGESLGARWVVALLAVGVALATWLMVKAWRAASPDPRLFGAGYLALLTLGAPAYFFISVGPGMALADSFAISGGDHSPWAAPLYVISGAAALGLVVLAATRPRPQALDAGNAESRR